MNPLPRFGCVIFDCDSTLSRMEGIEELAAEHRSEIAALTEAAMRGDVGLEEVYGRRLELIRPRRSRVQAVGRMYVELLVPDAREVVAALQAERIEVRILSGGIDLAVLAVAEALGIPAPNVAAVGLRFDEAGRYAGFDRSAPLSRSGGKAEVLRGWAGSLARPVMLVGDGATDLEAAGEVELFVAFAGVVDRPSATAGAEVVVRAYSLAPILPLALGGQAPASVAHRAVFERGLAMLDDAARRRLGR